jgi:hypothetical protein
MNKTEKNKEIKKQVAMEIAARGLSGQLEMYGCENTFQRRPRYWRDGKVCFFKVLMWDINELEGEALTSEIDSRVTAAQKYFGLREVK